MRKFFYWFIQFTWGLPLTLAGGILALLLIARGVKPQKFAYAIYFACGEHWGGLNLGGFFFVQKDADTSIKSHEYGHSLQNLLLGPLTPFLVTIPSALRYHYRRWKRAKGHPLPPYDQFWCEGWATKWGKKYSEG